MRALVFFLIMIGIITSVAAEYSDGSYGQGEYGVTSEDAAEPAVEESMPSAEGKGRVVPESQQYSGEEIGDASTEATGEHIPDAPNETEQNITEKEQQRIIPLAFNLVALIMVCLAAIIFFWYMQRRKT